MISTFILILASLFSIFISQVITKISVNYISLFVGIIIYFIPVLSSHVANFNSEIFIGMIVAPLLFFEGQATRLNAVGKEIKHIIQTTVILVIISLIVAGFSVSYLAKISLPLAFILAAISTPTDATAMDSVSNGLKMPMREGTFLKMESLFNDASGLILLNMAILWYVNGYINYTQTIVSFLISAVGGVLFGFIAAWVMVLFRQILVRTSYNSLNAQIFLYLLTPFILYYLAELIHVSGIITVVCAGLVHNAEADRSRLSNSRQVHFGFDLVRMITEIFNSVVFVILGFMFTRIIANEKFNSDVYTWILVGATLYVVNIIIRCIYGKMRLNMNSKSAWIFALGGVHGAVTLALAFILEEYAIKSSDFNLVLMSEGILILLSMIVPTIVFRFLLDKDVSNSEAANEMSELRYNMVKPAVEMVKKMYLPDNVKESVIFDLMSQKQKTKTRDFTKAWLSVVKHPEFTQEERELEMRAFMSAFAKEREYLDMVSQSEVKYQDYVYELYDEVLLAESLVIGPAISENSEKKND